MKKTLLLVSAIILFALAFTAPWLWLDNGEDIVESNFFRNNDEINFQKPKNTCDCDGDCLNVKWVPFGVKVDACAEDWYFVSFWWQRFHINGE